MIYALIVLYNKNMEDSLTYNFFKLYKDTIKIIVFDNSKDEFVNNNIKYCETNNIQYYTLHKNVGISKAYNYVINNIPKKDENYIIVLDDDTVFNEEYINELLTLSKEKKHDVLLPIIISNNKLISPANVQFNCRIKMLKNINQLKSDKISAINSGMIVRTSLYNKISYNEDIFLDYVDHDFMKQVRENKYDIYVMKCQINQNYARFQKNDIESEIFRFKIYLKDFKIYCKECHNILFYHLSVLKYKIRECIKYKNLKFLFLK